MTSTNSANANSPAMVAISGWGFPASWFEREIGGYLAVSRSFCPLSLAAKNGATVGERGVPSEYVQNLFEQLQSEKSLAIHAWSMGVLIALEFALNFPQMVESLTLYAATARFCAAAGYDCGQEAGVVRNLRREILRDPQRALGEFYRGLGLEEREGENLCLEILRERNNLQALRQGLDYLMWCDLRQLVANISCPVQLYHGDCDSLIPLAAGEFIASLLPTVEFQRVKGAGHFPWKLVEWM